MCSAVGQSDLNTDAGKSGRSVLEALAGEAFAAKSFPRSHIRFPQNAKVALSNQVSVQESQADVLATLAASGLERHQREGLSAFFCSRHGANGINRGKWLCRVPNQPYQVLGFTPWMEKRRVIRN